MANRRNFLKTTALATAGVNFKYIEDNYYEQK